MIPRGWWWAMSGFEKVLLVVCVLIFVVEAADLAFMVWWLVAHP